MVEAIEAAACCCGIQHPADNTAAQGEGVSSGTQLSMRRPSVREGLRGGSYQLALLPIRRLGWSTGTYLP